MQDEENLVAEVVAVQAGHLARLHTQKAGANVRRDEEVFDVFLLAKVENFKGHEQAPLRKMMGVDWPFPNIPKFSVSKNVDSRLST